MIDMLYQESTVYNQSIKLYTIYLIYSIIIYVHQFPQEIIFHFYGVLGFIHELFLISRVLGFGLHLIDFEIIHE